GAEMTADEAESERPESSAPQPIAAGTLRYGALALGPWDQEGRGRLRDATAEERFAGGDPEFSATVSSRVLVESELAARVAIPSDAPPLEESSGSFSYRYVSEGLVIGLGVEERLKVARRVQYAEGSRGMLGGGTTLEHRVEVEVASRLPSPVDVEVREIVPIKDEDEEEIEIAVADVTPPWLDFDQ